MQMMHAPLLEIFRVSHSIPKIQMIGVHAFFVVASVTQIFFWTFDRTVDEFPKPTMRFERVVSLPAVVRKLSVASV